MALESNRRTSFFKKVKRQARLGSELDALVLDKFANWKQNLPNLGRHTVRVALHARHLFPENEEIAYAAFLHDIGKDGLKGYGDSEQKTDLREVNRIRGKHVLRGYRTLRDAFPDRPLLAITAGMHHLSTIGEAQGKRGESSYGIPDKTAQRDFGLLRKKKVFSELKKTAIQIGIIDSFDAWMSRNPAPTAGKIIDIREELVSRHPGEQKFINSLIRSPLNGAIYSREKMAQLREITSSAAEENPGA